MPDTWLRIVNRTQGTLVATRAMLANTYLQRLAGWMARPAFMPGEGLYLTPCQAVHGLGLAAPIEVVGLDRGGRVRKISRLEPGAHWVWASGCRSILELAVGTCGASVSRCQLDDQLTLIPVEGRP